MVRWPCKWPWQDYRVPATLVWQSTEYSDTRSFVLDGHDGVSSSSDRDMDGPILCVSLAKSTSISFDQRRCRRSYFVRLLARVKSPISLEAPSANDGASNPYNCTGYSPALYN